jgi:hypothetical protein
MALLDLGLATRCFTTLLQERIPSFADWPGGANLAVSAGAPDLVSGNHALSFYLYHVRKDAHTEAQDWGAGGANPQRFKPMGVTLYYVLTPRSNLADAGLRALADQLMFGLALKTLRDTSFIDDSTTVDTVGGPKLLMPAAMRGLDNKLRCTLQPRPVEEAGHYWQAGSGAQRLAAFYEVTATLLEPDVPQSRSGRVLVAGVHSIVRGQPVIEAIENRISFQIPGSASTQTITASPAAAPYGDRLHIRGANLKGDVTQLLLQHRDLAAPAAVDAAWTLATDGTLLTVTVQPMASGTPILPGIYGAFVRTVARFTLPDGSQRDFDMVSNQQRFAIAPRIVTVTEAAAVLTITMDGFEPHTLADEDLMVFAGSDRLTRTLADPPGAGSYVTPPNPAADRVRLRLRFPATATSGSLLPLRIIVRGAESGPWWEVVP